MDEKIEIVLKELKPVSAPESMDRAILDAAGKKRQAGRGSWKIIRTFMTAAAVLLLMVFASIIIYQHDGNNGSGQPVIGEGGQSTRLDNRSILTAKANLLELKISRLKDLAVKSDKTGEYLKSISLLEEKLETISEELQNPVGLKTNNNESMYPVKKKGSKNA